MLHDICMPTDCMRDFERVPDLACLTDLPYCPSWPPHPPPRLAPRLPPPPPLTNSPDCWACLTALPDWPALLTPLTECRDCCACLMQKLRCMQESYVPTEVCKGLWIVPDWCEVPDPSALNIGMAPGLAFGTGDPLHCQPYSLTAACAWLYI